MASEGEQFEMNNVNNGPTEQRLAELEAENARLRQTLEMVKAERKELREKVYGLFSQDPQATEDEMTEFMKDRVPGDGMKFFAELGLLPTKSS
jgi:hypothetical protein